MKGLNKGLSEHKENENNTQEIAHNCKRNNKNKTKKE